MTETLIEQVKAKEARQRSELLHQYRALLLRHDNPRKGDGERLVELMAKLGKTSGALDADLVVIRKEAELERRSTWSEADQSGCDKAVEASSTHRDMMKAEIAKLEAEQRRRDNETGNAMFRHKLATEAAVDLKVLREKRADLFGVTGDEQK